MYHRREKLPELHRSLQIRYNALSANDRELLSRMINVYIHSNNDDRVVRDHFRKEFSSIFLGMFANRAASIWDKFINTEVESILLSYK